VERGAGKVPFVLLLVLFVAVWVREAWLYVEVMELGSSMRKLPASQQGGYFFFDAPISTFVLAA
jgi:hypothetical protein